MKKLSLGALFLGLATAACSGDGGNDVTLTPDAEEPDALVLCNANAQTGCEAGDKCTWIIVQDDPEVLGIMGCVDDGGVAEGEACTRGEIGAATGFDNCAAGLFCLGGVCEDTCSTNDTSDACDAGTICGGIIGLYANDTADIATGFCSPTCDPVRQKTVDDTAETFCGEPLDENDEQTEGCYGFYSSDATPSYATCANVINPTFDHGTNLTQELPDGVYRNACAAGHTISGFYTSATEGDLLCLSFCEPGDVYEGFTENANGLLGSPYSLTAQGITDPAEECRYYWAFEGADTPLSESSYGVGMAYNIGIFGSSDGTTFFPAVSCTLVSIDDTDDSGESDAIEQGCANPENFPALTGGRQVRRPDRNYGKVLADPAMLSAVAAGYKAARDAK